MRTTLFCSALLLFTASAAGAQVVTLAQSPPELVRVYQARDNITVPDLLGVSITTVDCDKPVSGQVDLATIVDASGAPRNTMLIHPLGNQLDALALNTLAAERFKPGESNGSPVAVAVSVSMKLETCAVQLPAGSGTGSSYLRVHGQPHLHLGATDAYPSAVEYSNATPGSLNGGVYRPRSDVSPPVMLLASPIVELGSGTRPKYQGEVMLTLIVDSFGMPLNVRVTRPLGMGLDEKAIDVMRKARFKPAMLKGRQPVPVMVTVAVPCRIY